MKTFSKLQKEELNFLQQLNRISETPMGSFAQLQKIVEDYWGIVKEDKPNSELMLGSLARIAAIAQFMAENLFLVPQELSNTQKDQKIEKLKDLLVEVLQGKIKPMQKEDSKFKTFYYNEGFVKKIKELL